VVEEMARQLSMATRRELKEAVGERYRAAKRGRERQQILSEFVRVTGYHRKHALRVLNQPAAPPSPPARGRLYDEAVHQALTVLWEAGDRICGKRLRPLVPIMLEAMERHGHLQLAPDVRTRLLTMSAATMDRALSEARGQPGRKSHRRAAPSAAVRRSVPVRTFSDWGDPAPGFVEADLVAHSGPIAAGNFVQTLVLTDIATGWTECAPCWYESRSCSPKFWTWFAS